MVKLLILIATHILLLNSVQFIAWPENFLWPYLSQNGLVFYKDIFALYPPVYYELLSGFTRLFGISVLSLQLFNSLIVILIDVLLWKAANKRFLPLILFIPIQIFFEGNGSWPDLLLAPVFLGAYISFKEKRWLLLGILLAVGLFIKQTAVYFALILFLAAVNRQSLPKIVLGGAITCLAAGIYFVFNQNFENFIRDAVIYILTFHSKYELQRQWPSTAQAIQVLMLLVPAILIGVAKRKFLLVFLCLSSMLGVFTRFEYFHLQPGLPFVALLLAVSPVGIVIWFGFLVFFIRYFLNSFSVGPRFVVNPQFPKLQKGEETAFINTWDHYYYLSNTLPVNKVFVPSTPWTMDFPGNQEKVIKALAHKKPRYVFMHECFNVRGVCYKPRKVYNFVISNYSQSGKLADGTGIFQYDPVTVREKP